MGLYIKLKYHIYITQSINPTLCYVTIMNLIDVIICVTISITCKSPYVYFRHIYVCTHHHRRAVYTILLADLPILLAEMTSFVAEFQSHLFMHNVGKSDIHCFQSMGSACKK